MKLNLGCGDHTPAGWINVDYSLGARLAKLPMFKRLNSELKMFNLDWNKDIRLHDLTKRFPWPNDSIDVVYSSHTLEHMTREQGRSFLKECRRVLKPNGTIRIVVPDLAETIRQYSNGELPADRFLDELGVSFSSPQDGPIKRRFAFLIRYPHRCMYDSKSLLCAMNEIGFDSGPRKKLDSDIDDIEEVELRSLTYGSVIVEGKKKPG